MDLPLNITVTLSFIQSRSTWMKTAKFAGPPSGQASEHLVWLKNNSNAAESSVTLTLRISICSRVPLKEWFS